jgi:hypothetical protein
MTSSPITVAIFTDGRDNKELIGENREDDEPKPVTTPCGMVWPPVRLSGL